jgi:hypothetical protein
MFLKSRRAGDSREEVRAQRAHLRALGALGVHGVFIVNILNTRNVVTWNIYILTTISKLVRKERSPGKSNKSQWSQIAEELAQRG